jgi:hypothetical protein
VPGSKGACYFLIEGLRACDYLCYGIYSLLNKSTNIQRAWTPFILVTALVKTDF